ncbi:MAG: SemiSWEET transporter [bacterium]
MDITLMLGSLAAFCTTIAFLPQVIKTHQSHHTKDLSLSMFIIFSFGLIFWLIYGLAINSIPVIVANCITLLLSLYILYMKLRFG